MQFERNLNIRITIRQEAPLRQLSTHIHHITISSFHINDNISFHITANPINIYHISMGTKSLLKKQTGRRKMCVHLFGQLLRVRKHKRVRRRGILAQYNARWGVQRMRAEINITKTTHRPSCIVTEKLFSQRSVCVYVCVRACAFLRSC